MMKRKKKETINPIILAISVITLFVFIISFAVFYAKETFSPVCGCTLPIWVILISIASFGMFTGSLVYYLLNKNVLDLLIDVNKTEKPINKLLNFLEGDEKNILEFIINNSGEVNQSRISKELDTDRVKTSRVISKLEKKGIVKKEEKGMTNRITLDGDLKKFFKK